MIVTESKAISIISNEEVVKKVKGLAHLFEEFRSTERKLKEKTGCKSCTTSEPEFGPLREKAVKAIRGLSDADRQKLKDHYVTKNLVFYERKDGKPKKIVL